MNQINRMGLGLMLMAILLAIVGIYLVPASSAWASVRTYIGIVIALVGLYMLAWEEE